MEQLGNQQSFHHHPIENCYKFNAGGKFVFYLIAIEVHYNYYTKYKGMDEKKRTYCVIIWGLMITFLRQLGKVYKNDHCYPLL